MTTSEAAFDQWYSSTPDVNRAFVLYLVYSAGSNFRVDTTLAFTDCGTVVAVE